MDPDQATRLLAKLVHNGHLERNRVAAAFASGDPLQWLLREGDFTDAQWQEWLATDGGDRPQLKRYEIEAELGQGGMARVFQAVDRTDGKSVALKVLRPEGTADPRHRDGFIREARLLIELDDPHLVKGFRVAKEGQTVYFAMECLAGQCLQEGLDEDHPLPESDAIAVVAQVARGLAALQARGLVHRDVKPGNIMWDPETRRAVLIDLGFAVAGSDSDSSETTAGTVHYIAPEQAKGSGGLDTRADIYSLGATLYHLVTGSLPFTGDSGQEVLARQVRDALSGERIRELGLAPQTHYFIEKMMAKDRDHRFADAAELATALAGELSRREEAEQAARPRGGRHGGGTGAGGRGGTGTGGRGRSGRRRRLF